MKKGNETQFKQLWEPTAAFKAGTNLAHYIEWLNREYGLDLPPQDYERLWHWSVDHLELFWESIWRYCRVESGTPYARVLSGNTMPDYRWFEGATLNYAAHIFRNETSARPALLFDGEIRPYTEVSWAELRAETAALQATLRRMGVTAGDRIVAYLPNIREAVVGLLATSALGATWSSCSPDFGTNAVIDRFRQISPKVLLAVDGYRYGGKAIDKREAVVQLAAALPSVEQVIFVPYLDPASRPPAGVDGADRESLTWGEATRPSETPLQFEMVPFDHPLWVLYSSGTTGIPKAITHGHGGIVVEHLKLHIFHNDLKPGDRYFWMSTTGWVMWNIGVGSLLAGATALFYDGNPAFPDMTRMWQLAERAQLNVFGTSAAFLIANMKAGIIPGQFGLDNLVSIGSTGSPLPIEGFEWVYANVKPDLWLVSASGGTDVASGFVGGCPLLPVYAGELQCRHLGVDIHALDEHGDKLIGTVGEMVITRPMPSMPLYFWNDEGNVRYRASYFEMYPGLWRHGDWMRISELGTIEISGRSDSTLNRLGVRIGSSEIYRAVDSLPEVVDSLVIGMELENGGYYMPLFVQLPEGETLDPALSDKIKGTIRANFTPRHVPDEIIQIPEVPYTLSGKKLETPVKRLLQGGRVEEVVNVDATRSPAAIDFFVDFERQSKQSPTG